VRHRILSWEWYCHAHAATSRKPQNAAAGCHILRTVKTYLSQASNSWMMEHHGRAIGEGQIGGLVRQAFERTATAGIARKGFQETGIWPLNPLVFSELDFAPSKTSERPLAQSEEASGESPVAAKTTCQK